MNRYIASFFCAALALSTAPFTAAANHKNPMPGPDTGVPARLTSLIGAKVENGQAEKIGTVSDLAVDFASGRIVHVIVRSGGFLSLGSRTLAIPPGAVRFDAATATAHVDLPQDRLKTAPDFDTAQWGDFYKSDRAQEADRFYGNEPHLASAQSENVRQASKILQMPVLNRQDERIGSVEDMMVELRSGRVVAAVVSSGGFLGMGDSLNAIPPSALQFATAPDGLRLDMDKTALLAAPRFKNGEWPDFAQRDYTESVDRAYKVDSSTRNDGRPTAHLDNAARMGRDLSASVNAGATDRNANTTNRNTSTADRTAGAGDRNVIDRNDRRTTGDNANSTRNTDERNVANRDDRRPVDADNSGRNVRDRDNRTRTAGDQSDAPSDVKITQVIRQAVVATEGLSVNAQNVKIITVDGHVTLRGPVASAAEKTRIGEIAARTASRDRVDNQLEVTTR